MPICHFNSNHLKHYLVSLETFWQKPKALELVSQKLAVRIKDIFEATIYGFFQIGFYNETFAFQKSSKQIFEFKTN